MVPCERLFVKIVTATRTEANAVRKALPDAHVIVTGMGLRAYHPQQFDSAVVCGVAGGLRRGVPTGTVVIASEIRRTDGSSIQTDSTLAAAFARGARALGFEPLVEPILASTTLVAGAQRSAGAWQGCAAVDMESGGISAERLAVVRVILDTPEREISPEWLHPMRAMLQPRLWPELLWLAANAPRCAGRAAAVVAAGLRIAHEEHGDRPGGE
jgi:hypothetical protein